MSPDTSFAVDLDLLADTIADLTCCERTFDELLDRLRARVRTLHVTWTGQAALAHDAAQTEWESGFAAMRDGLCRMRAAGEVAHCAYTDAVEVNVAIWRLS